MATGLNKLSAKAVKDRKNRGRLGDGGGLWLNITNSGSKAWVYRWTPKGGKPREIGLGPYPAVSLMDAREIAGSCRAMVAKGLDPKLERQKSAEPTFAECCEIFLAANEHSWSNAKHRAQWRMTLTAYCKKIADRKISEIMLTDVRDTLAPIWTEKPETASRLRGRIERVFDHAIAEGWRDTTNPAQWRGGLKALLPPIQKKTTKHFDAMEYSKVPAFFEKLSEHEALAARALELAILTVGRTGEVLGATWNEIDLGTSLWTIPAYRMKTRKDHVVPLTDAAVKLLVELHELRTSEFVFPGQKVERPLSNMSMLMLLRRMKIENVTVHGFRSSFRDWAGNETEFPREVAEACLAHEIGNAVERAYRRSKAIEKQRLLLSAWAHYVCRKSS